MEFYRQCFEHNRQDQEMVVSVIGWTSSHPLLSSYLYVVCESQNHLWRRAGKADRSRGGELWCLFQGAREFPLGDLSVLCCEVAV